MDKLTYSLFITGQPTRSFVEFISYLPSYNSSDAAWIYVESFCGCCF